MSKSIMAYHFTAEKLRDGRPIPPIGEWLVHEGPVTICETGLHASEHPFDALQYARGQFLHRVECEDIVAQQRDKFVCRRRKIVASIDATDMLWRFARARALSVIHLWDAPAHVREYLETGNEDLRATASAAAWSAASAAARVAAWDAASATAWYAAWSAARATAWYAAWSAASATARAAAWSAASATARATGKESFRVAVEVEFAKQAGAVCALLRRDSDGY